MAYQGTSGNDNIDQNRLQLPDWTFIFAGAGDDTITIFRSSVAGEQGNDQITVLDPYSQVGYWNSPAGIDANLSTGRVSDGFGTVDVLFGVKVLATSGFDDRVTGSSNSETFWGSAGFDHYDGDLGTDTVSYYGLSRADATLSYDALTGVWTVDKKSAAFRGLDRLHNIEAIRFVQADGSSQTVTAQDLIGPFRQSTPLAVSSPSAQAGLQQLVTGDFNGDGHLDLWMNNLDGPSVGAQATAVQILAGNGQGGFTDVTTALWRGVVPQIQFAPRLAAADFNADGVTDVFVPDFGMDKPPFPGGQNRLFLSEPAGLRDASAALVQRLTQAHGVSVGDVSGDGRPDILVNQLNDPLGQPNALISISANGTVQTRSNGWPTAVQAGTGFAPGHTWSYLGDLNADGRPDAVLGTWDANPKTSVVLLNTGQSEPFAQSRPVSLPRSGVDKEIVLAIKPIDLNRDALPDLVLSITNGGDFDTFYYTPYLQFLVNQGGGVFTDETATRLPQDVNARPGGWYKFIDVVDLNGDGHLDLLTSYDAFQVGGVSQGGIAYLNDGQGRFSELRTFTGYSTVHAVDINGDGIPEVVGGNSNGLNIWWNDLHTGSQGRHSSTLADDTFWGGDGLDTAVFAHAMARYKIEPIASSVWRVRDLLGWDGADTLSGIERLEFADRRVALDLDGNAGVVSRLLGAVFGPEALDNTQYAGIGLSLLDGGMSSSELVNLALTVALGNSRSNAAVVTLLYENIVGVKPNNADLASFVGLIDSGQYTQTGLVEFAMNLDLNAQRIGLVGLQTNGLEYLAA